MLSYSTCFIYPYSLGCGEYLVNINFPHNDISHHWNVQSADACFQICMNSRGAGLRPAPRSLYKGLAGSDDTRCDKVWYKM